MRRVAIIVSAGKGARFKNKIPKQYIRINGRPLIYYTLFAFNSCRKIDGIILVTAKDRIDYCKQLVKKYNLKKVFSVVGGGHARAHSVYNGLKAMPRAVKIVAIHDGVRPLIKQELIEEVMNKASRFGAAIIAVPSKNTIKEVSNNLLVKKTLARKDLVEVQTPQAFRYGIIMDCYNKFSDKLESVTDDSSLAEMAGYKVKVVNGDYENIKITTKEDLEFAKTVLTKSVKGAASQMKVGVGYDIHRLEKGRRLILGGVAIPGRYGLLGHSDADVLLHAITDAMLGSVGERDIGWHFSNNNKKFKDMASSFFLLSAKKILEKKGYKIGNIDSTIIAQEPKLQPYYPEMVKNISNWLGINKKDVTVKFTTPEEVGPLGARKAIAGMAIVSAIKVK